MSRAKKQTIRQPKKIEPMTISEFRAKLEGIEMFQPEDWVPTADQWALIREMINSIVEIPSQHVVQYPPGVRAAPPRPQQVDHHQPMGTQTALPPLVPPPADGAELANMPLSKIRAMQEVAAGGGGKPAKTPHIDTSGGAYTSPFAE